MNWIKQSAIILIIPVDSLGIMLALGVMLLLNTFELECKQEPAESSRNKNIHKTIVLWNTYPVH